MVRGLKNKSNIKHTKNLNSQTSIHEEKIKSNAGEGDVNEETQELLHSGRRENISPVGNTQKAKKNVVKQVDKKDKPTRIRGGNLKPKPVSGDMPTTSSETTPGEVAELPRRLSSSSNQEYEYASSELPSPKKRCCKVSPKVGSTKTQSRKSSKKEKISSKSKSPKREQAQSKTAEDSFQYTRESKSPKSKRNDELEQRNQRSSGKKSSGRQDHTERARSRSPIPGVAAETDGQVRLSRKRNNSGSGKKKSKTDAQETLQPAEKSNGSENKLNSPRHSRKKAEEIGTLEKNCAGPSKISFLRSPKKKISPSIDKNSEEPTRKQIRRKSPKQNRISSRHDIETPLKNVGNKVIKKKPALKTSRKRLPSEKKNNKNIARKKSKGDKRQQKRKTPTRRVQNARRRKSPGPTN